MAKKKEIVYKCSECGYSQPRWLGRCPQCGAWNTLAECIVDPNSTTAAFTGNSATEKVKPVPLSLVSAQENARIVTGIQEFDRVLGGGAMRRSAILIGGEPGIGKSTLMVQACAAIRKATPGKVLYVSGEESAGQVKGRADRLSLDTSGIEILCTMRLEDIKDALVALNPVFVVIDSIQTVYSVEAGIVPGTVNQLKFCANELIGWVKERDSVMVMSAHVTKDGVIAGPKSLEHMVDTVISFERNDDEVRFLRASKNRFGSVDELGIFAMGEDGLSCVGDPSAMFVTKRTGKTPAGIANTCVFEGSRAFVVEIQALTVPAKSSMSRVYSDKIDSARVARVAAVLEKRTGLRFSDMDLYINVAGGVRLAESAIDAALAAALYSARTDVPILDGSVIIGEVSLAGEVRPVQRVRQRVKTARELGFRDVLAPDDEDGARRISSVKEMLAAVFAK
ncbi:DNA repair protein RadA [Treponema saccharophilum]|uniref:DNA repair protein RadA n=2 Tax=Treponema saccharophilum TaxID=165 RepID=H7ENF9_9SPIR|nr:DNA repair protein RadA [Treponema saccharophilum]EIC00887.1 DNA repair protein RadA [Treponema saccharophilum DSM 2985]BDC95193.1 DNA repair protein RadA [Treponema saccharophilum]